MGPNAQLLVGETAAAARSGTWDLAAGGAGRRVTVLMGRLPPGPSGQHGRNMPHSVGNAWLIGMGLQKELAIPPDGSSGPPPAPSPTAHFLSLWMGLL